MSHSPNWFLSFLVLVTMTANSNGFQCEGGSSVYGRRLWNHVIHQSSAKDASECAIRCREKCYCHSMNYRLADNLCQCNKASKTSHGKDYRPEQGIIYMDFGNPKLFYKSCMELKKENSSARSGYYDLVVNDRCLIAYCDMRNFDGGWTLVVSISSQNNDHLQTSQHNCLNSSLCVPYENVTENVTTEARKLADVDIHEIAAYEGTYRVHVMPIVRSAFDVFYQFPGGADNFNSECVGVKGNCPRIIISHSSFPYAWESNCRGTAVGYVIPEGCHRVFDGYDNGEFGGGAWTSSHLQPGYRALYAFPCPSSQGDSLGLYRNYPGMLFVR